MDGGYKVTYRLEDWFLDSFFARVDAGELIYMTPDGHRVSPPYAGAPASTSRPSSGRGIGRPLPLCACGSTAISVIDTDTGYVAVCRGCEHKGAPAETVGGAIQNWRQYVGKA